MRFYFVFTLVTALVLLCADAIMIPFVMRPLFQAALGDTMAAPLRLLPAALFYIIHVAGIVWFSGRSYQLDNRLFMAGLNGAILGLVAYSCYEMTSWTIMRDWHVGLVVVDVGWGTIISAIAALLGATTARRWQ